MSDVHQELMIEAYDQWKENQDWSSDEFVSRLDYAHRVAVLTGNLNYQVENGGFDQWHFNGYSKHSDQLQNVLLQMETETTHRVANMVRTARRRLEDDRSCEDLDTEFYDINYQLLIDVEAYLQKEVA